ncbi:hypothetical protein [Erwinia tasmaniensis]|uniref:Uncharacterized protein n=1 Tax=Erwinia tasmaniensis (strain DSM 17950 / CFBP 7177 / CIP 109463 / NCPPB 4357 / Et1/99) TaxID=465817 RepID=B2VIU6_ERWT9|nr:hypothetical protein [Erwinia tasmaniensis]CAO96243.1 hypothetical protein ETA_11970 [Erwinia tasmaniensis Et1/99]
MPAPVLASAPDFPHSLSSPSASNTPVLNRTVHPVTVRIASVDNAASDMAMVPHYPGEIREDRSIAIARWHPGNPVVQRAADDPGPDVLLREGDELYRMALDWMNSLIEKMPRLVDVCVVMASFLVFSYGLICIYAMNRERIYTDRELFGEDISVREQLTHWVDEMDLIMDASGQKPLSSDTRVATRNKPYWKHE